jgi:iron complex transport system substrate-binding protein
VVKIADTLVEATQMRPDDTGRVCDSGRRRALARLAACMAAPACLLPPWRAAFADDVAHTTFGAARRVVVLDWDLTEIVLSLGLVPVGVARPLWYRNLNSVPPLPAQVVDTGLLFQPNFEVLHALRPDLIIITNWHEMLRTQLEKIAPTLSVTIYQSGQAVLPGLREQTLRLGTALGRAAQAEALLARLDGTLARCARRLADADSTGAARRAPLFLLRPIDGRHVTVYGARSLFGGVAGKLGLRNAWQGSTDIQGMAQTDLAELATAPDARAILNGAPLPNVASDLADSPLWRGLPFVAGRKLATTTAIAPTGGPMSAMRFADALTDVLTEAQS